MLPGLFQPMLSVNNTVAYAPAIAAITNKTLYARADTSVATNGNTLSTTSWDNEVSATDIIGAAQWATNSFGTNRGVLSNTVGNSGSSQLQVSQIIGGDQTFTCFAVEKRNGTQGVQTVTARYQNNIVIGGSDYWSMVFEGSSRQFCMYTYNGSYVLTNTGFSFTDGVPYCLAWRSDGSGNLRVNFNGSISTFAGGVSTPASQTNVVTVNNNQNAAGPNYGAEYIVSSDSVSDTIMDNTVLALKAKWGIT